VSDSEVQDPLKEAVKQIADTEIAAIPEDVADRVQEIKFQIAL
jgi:hypothetical protein